MDISNYKGAGHLISYSDSESDFVYLAQTSTLNAQNTSAVLRLECSIDCISGSVGH